MHDTIYGATLGDGLAVTRKSFNDPQKRAIDVGVIVPEGVSLLDGVTVADKLGVSVGVSGGVCVDDSKGDTVFVAVIVEVGELDATVAVPLGVPEEEAVPESVEVPDDVCEGVPDLDTVTLMEGELVTVPVPVSDAVQDTDPVTDVDEELVVDADPVPEGVPD